ncbi:MAG: GNAT family N-acetyltransferase [Candidatus Hodarchaeales archaeon]
MQKGYKAFWDCLKDNLKSIKTAQKLGFNLKSEYETIFASVKQK